MQMPSAQVVNLQKPVSGVADVLPAAALTQCLPEQDGQSCRLQQAACQHGQGRRVLRSLTASSHSVYTAAEQGSGLVTCECDCKGALGIKLADLFLASVEEPTVQVTCMLLHDCCQQGLLTSCTSACCSCGPDLTWQIELLQNMLTWCNAGPSPAAVASCCWSQEL
jgi:hypothetical protein